MTQNDVSTRHAQTGVVQTGQFQIGTALISAKTIEAGLYIVATPIGHLSDMTVRALETLSAVDIIACEDTRTSKKLLDRYHIKTRTTAYHEHNAEYATAKLVAALDEGKSIALISDAGTPLISDPGYRIVNAASDAGHKVIPIPGASSVLTALMACGLATDNFYFAGFLPSKSKARKDRLANFKGLNMAQSTTLIFFESPNRILNTLIDAIEIYGQDIKACICRELTKAHEEFARGSLKELHEEFQDRVIKGEIVFVLHLEHTQTDLSEEEIRQILLGLPEGLSTSQAAGEAAKLTSRPKKEMYQLLLKMKDQ